MADAMEFGAGNCLLSRMDLFPCNFANPRTTGEPEANYKKNELMRFRVQCPRNEIGFFNISIQNLEGATCLEPATGVNRCLDYVTMDRGTSGFTESCGTTLADHREQLTPGTVNMTFRTSPSLQFPGFMAFLICVDPNQRDPQPNCTRPVDSTTTNNRRRRDLEEFNDQWRRNAALHIQRMRRHAEGGNGMGLRFRKIDVPFGRAVSFSNAELNFISMDNQAIIESMRIPDVSFLYTFDRTGKLDQFRREAISEGNITLLPGPGPLHVVGRFAYFQLFDIDPRGLFPNMVELQAIANITNALIELVIESGGDGATEPLTSEISPPPLPPNRKRRQASALVTDTLDDSVIAMAVENENACNPPLKNSANSMLQEIERVDPARLRCVRESRLEDCRNAE